MISQKKILVVEDNPINREILCAILSEQYTVLQAENGQEALDILQTCKNEIALILLDVIMPVMDGYDAAAGIRRMKDEKKASIPIIAMTANAFAEDKQKAISMGMNDHVAKPIDMDVLLPVIAKYIR